MVYVLSMSCLCLVYVLSMSCLSLVYVLSISMSFLCLVYVLSMSCQCLVYVFSICLVYVLSMYCLNPSNILHNFKPPLPHIIWPHIMFCVANSNGHTKWVKNWADLQKQMAKDLELHVRCVPIYDTRIPYFRWLGLGLMFKRNFCRKKSHIYPRFILLGFCECGLWDSSVQWSTAPWTFHSTGTLVLFILPSVHRVIKVYIIIHTYFHNIKTLLTLCSSIEHSFHLLEYLYKYFN